MAPLTKKGGNFCRFLKVNGARSNPPRSSLVNAGMGVERQEAAISLAL